MNIKLLFIILIIDFYSFASILSFKFILRYVILRNLRSLLIYNQIFVMVQNSRSKIDNWISRIEISLCLVNLFPVNISMIFCTYEIGIGFYVLHELCFIS